MENRQLEQTDILVPEESEFKEGDRVAKVWFIFTALWFPDLCHLRFFDGGEVLLSHFFERFDVG